MEEFLRHLKIEILTKLMVLLAGTMIFELAVKNVMYRPMFHRFIYICLFLGFHQKHYKKTLMF